MNLLILLVLNSLFIIGLNKATMIEWISNSPMRITKKNLTKNFIDKEYSMILWELQYYSLKLFGFKWSKPLITCPPCMASFHSILFYWYIGWEIFPESYCYSGGVILINYILYVFALCGLNTILNRN